ncbi:MAG: SPOR domain-containing protein [Paracoccaceae bacterium]
MAEIQFGEAGVGSPTISRANLAGIVNWIGALISVTLIAGLAWWGYQLMVRDVSGVPVVRALDGPMRVSPLDPGGSSADYQGLAVNNIAAVGEAEAPADRLVLAPKPTILNSEDQTAGALGALLERQRAAMVSDTEAEATTAIQTVTSNAEQDEVVVADQATLIEATLRLVESATAETGVATTTIIQTDAISTEIAGVSHSMRPAIRPAGMLVVRQVRTETTSGATEVNSINPADIPVGTRLVQLGAFETSDIARQEWLKAASRFEEFMAGKSRVIEQAQSGGKVFYRLRAHGFDDLADARRFCSALLAAQANCIPVVTR